MIIKTKNVDFFNANLIYFLKIKKHKKVFQKNFKKVLTKKKTYCIIQIVHREGEQKVH